MWSHLLRTSLSCSLSSVFFKSWYCVAQFCSRCGLKWQTRRASFNVLKKSLRSCWRMPLRAHKAEFYLKIWIPVSSQLNFPQQKDFSKKNFVHIVRLSNDAIWVSFLWENSDCTCWSYWCNLLCSCVAAIVRVKEHSGVHEQCFVEIEQKSAIMRSACHFRKRFLLLIWKQSQYNLIFNC